MDLKLKTQRRKRLILVIVVIIFRVWQNISKAVSDTIFLAVVVVLHVFVFGFVQVDLAYLAIVWEGKLACAGGNVGLAVDDTIHVMMRYRQLAEGMDRRCDDSEAILNVLKEHASSAKQLEDDAGAWWVLLMPARLLMLPRLAA